jgi:uncharacterized membrane protein
MNWKLIFQLSLFGLVMAFATISLVPEKSEFVFWLVIFIICAYLIVKNCSGRYFLHGFLVSIVNSIWITGAHVFFHKTYLDNHPQMVSMSADMFLPHHPRLQMLILGPIYGAAFGIVLGVFAWVASKLIKKPTQA